MGLLVDTGPYGVHASHIAWRAQLHRAAEPHNVAYHKTMLTGTRLPAKIPCQVYKL